MWDYVGMARNAPGLEDAVQKIRALRNEFWEDVTVPGERNNLNPMLDYAGRVADYMEFAELLALDALHRNESCGGHFREEFQTPDGEALRDDAHYTYVAAWEFTGVGSAPKLHREPLIFDEVHPAQRSYK
jgi:succinate dehydrogenase / fumarate reductase flavoprotein subunit